MTTNEAIQRVAEGFAYEMQNCDYSNKTAAELDVEAASILLGKRYEIVQAENDKTWYIVEKD